MIYPEEYYDFFLKSRVSLIKYECLEFSHSAFSKTYRIVRNATAGLNVRHENGEWYDYEYYPLKIETLGASDNLESGFSITLGDLGQIIPLEARRIMAMSEPVREKPVVTYRAYRSDILERPMVGPRITELKAPSYTREGTTFESKAPTMDAHGTGEIYTLRRFPSQRGFL